MKRNINSLLGFAMAATDGEIGKVKDFYFDDKTWTIRYLIVETGSWLYGRKVLISPEALLATDWVAETFPVNLTKEQIRNSPDVDTEKPVSRQQEMKLYEHYPWTGYWSGSLWGGGMGTIGMVTPRPVSAQQAAYETDSNLGGSRSSGDQHLRSTDKVKGYSIKAIDGEIGDVEDFIIDDRTWELDFLVVDTGNWFPGKKVLISPKWIKEVNWETSSVIVNVSTDAVKNSPEYDRNQYLSDEYSNNLHNYYGRFISHKQ